MASIRDTPLGQLLRAVGFKQSLRYPEEVPGFTPPAMGKPVSGTKESSPSTSSANTIAEDCTIDEEKQAELPFTTSAAELEDSNRGTMLAQHDALPPAEVESKMAADDAADIVVVDWYNDQDSANPRNWTASRKAWVTFIVCMYTFVVYCASAIFVPSYEWIMIRYGVSQELASLGLAMYVAGYGIGPMIFSPISEIAYVGRNPPYLISFVMFLVVSIVTAVVADKSFAGLIVLRFLQGFYGSPILASGGASLEDIYDWSSVPYAFIFWIAAMYCGPALGPLMSAYAVPHNWRWSLWEIVIMAGIVFVVLLSNLPETSRPNILYRRARRLRKATCNTNYRSPAELVRLDPMGIFADAMTKPLEILVKDPAIGFACVYGSLVYAIYYSFFEVFPLVYVGIYHFTLGAVGLMFLCVIAGCAIFATVYALYLHYVFGPESRRREMVQETRLRAALPAVFLLPIGLFIFAWTARADIYWILPTIGIVIYSGSSFVVFQCILCYVPLTYPKYVASLFAGNDMSRSLLAAGFIMFSRPMYLNLGIGKGVSLLGGLSIMGILGMFYLWKYGDRLRARSKFAES